MTPTRHLVIAGVPKAGTTSLFEYLAQHPDVHPSRVRQTAFFKQPSGDLQDYLDQFRGASDGQWLLESTPGYLARGRPVAERIHDLLPGARVVVSLRDPADRVVSHYRMKARAGVLGDPPPTLREFVAAADTAGDPWGAANAVRAGDYARHLGEWFDVFGEALRVQFLDDLVADPRHVLRDLCGWLEIDPGAVDSLDLGARNRGVRHRSRALARVAQAASHGLRPVFQRYPRTRGLLRDVHQRVNGARPDTTAAPDDHEVRVELAAHYAPANRDLARLLRDRGHTRLPAWVDAGLTTLEGERQA
jgi:hypothetical protein